MIYYTIEEAADRIKEDKYTPEWLLTQMINPDKDSSGGIGFFLTPSWYSDEPLLLMTQEAGNSLPGWFSGWFEVGSINETNRIRGGVIHFDTPARYLHLSRDGVRYTPCSDPDYSTCNQAPFKIQLEELRISEDELEFFAERAGIKLKQTAETVSPTVITKKERTENDPLNRTGKTKEVTSLIIGCIKHLSDLKELTGRGTACFTALLNKQSALEKEKRLEFLQGIFVKTNKEEGAKYLTILKDNGLEECRSLGYIKKRFREERKTFLEISQQTPLEK
jgi:hypothetical protein